MTSAARPIAVLAALGAELARLDDALQDRDVVRHGGREFHRGRLDGQDVVLVLSRVGKVAAAVTATLVVERFDAGQVVFTGLAGGLAPGVAVGDVVVAEELLQHDLDASPLFPRYEIPYTGISRFRTDPVLVEAMSCSAQEALADVLPELDGDVRAAFGLHRPRVHRGLVISGDRFVSTAAECAALTEALPDALAVEMEGAAVAQACHDLGVPCAVVRVISDRADDAAHVDFPAFVDRVAAPYTAAAVHHWLRSLPPSGADRTG